jgi:feruloyl esterase
MRIVQAAIVVALGMTPAAEAATPCEELAALALPAATIDMAVRVPAGDVTLPGGQGGEGQRFAALPAFCRVAATLRPTSDSDIKIEVWLPSSGWNGKLQAVGNGGWAGSISYGAMVTALKAGYATTSTDTGHTSPGGAFVHGHPEKLADFSWRSVHEMTVKAKAVIDAHYGQAPSRSYFNGCSTGGKQGLIEATRFPADYDGIVAGDPANLRAYRNTWQVSVINQIQKNPGGAMAREELELLHGAVMNACDAIDGVKDGLLEDPKACSFDPATLACTGGDASAACLTPAQVRSAKILLSPGTVGGKAYHPGLERGSELGWSLWTSAEPSSQQSEFFKYVVYENPDFDWTALDPETALPLAVEAAKADSAEAKDLGPFIERGGKIILYHGWADPTVAPQASINYYTAAQASTPNAKDSIRMFLVPGMGHCRGGEGATDNFDAVAALDAWVETGRAPTRVHATNVTNGRVNRSRPLCPYPQIATYTGTGSTDEAANFVCAALSPSAAPVQRSGHPGQSVPR